MSILISCCLFIAATTQFEQSVAASSMWVELAQSIMHAYSDCIGKQNARSCTKVTYGLYGDHT